VRTDHVNTTPTSTPPSIFFSDFITIFQVKMQNFPYLAFFSSILVTGFKCHSGYQTPSTVPLHINDSLDHIYFFFFCSFMIFQLYLHQLLYLEMCTDHINSTLTPSITVSIMCILFCLILQQYSYQLPSLEKCTDHVKSTPTLSPILMISTIPFFLILLLDLDTPNHQDLVFLNFLVIHFFLIFWLQCVSYHIWKCAQTM
jgi:hypothetical protein